MACKDATGDSVPRFKFVASTAGELGSLVLVDCSEHDITVSLRCPTTLVAEVSPTPFQNLAPGKIAETGTLRLFKIETSKAYVRRR